MLQTAIYAAKTAGRILIEKRYQFKTNEIVHKGVGDFVTEVDVLSEKTILRIINGKFPDHAVLAEESGQKSSDSPYCWIVDPLDGTTNYIHGYPMFSVSIALQKDDEIIVGAIYDPIRDELFCAEKGKGAFLNGESIQVTDTTEKEMTLLATGFPFSCPEIVDHYLNTFKALFELCSDMRRAGSAALDLAHVACGRLDGFWEFNRSAWDVAAGSLIVTEAGGKVSEMDGSDNWLQTGNVVVANPALHASILQKIQQVQ